MIKRTPSDFQVEEVLSPAFLALVRPEVGGTLSPAAGAPFALYRLHKESLATPEAVGHIARELKIHAHAVAYAGLKDKHARAIQHVTLNLQHAANAPEKASSPGWQLERLGSVPRSITATDIECNRFRITIRNLTADECADLDEAARLLAFPAPSPGALRIVNYFGDQRFGSARHGQGFIARHLIRGDFEGALRLAIATEARKDRMEQKVFKRTLCEHWGRWREALPKLRRCPERKAIERLSFSGGDFRAAFCALPYLLQQMSVYAYQSFLWNAIARRLVALRCAPLGKVIAADDPFGEMLFPAAEAIPAELADVQVPLLSRKTELREPWKAAAEDVLKAEGIETAALQIPGVRRPFFGEEPRALFFAAADFQTTPPQPDETAKEKARLKRTVAFSLPRGSYATVVLRALGQ
ncbi:MAG: tRNA pseudouridine(13) synthase TruD [Planctomycetota bacterium]|nr:tRNA pseudouridine(13) synthase TruD [Planctomycetota bacterium]